MSVGVIVGTVLLTIGITRLVEYAIYDKKQSDKGVWKNDNIYLISIRQLYNK